MKRKSISLPLALLLVGGLAMAGLLAADQQVVEPDPDMERILWSKADRQSPQFIPAALLEGVDLTSRETIDLSHLPLTASQEASLKFFLLAEPDDPDGCFRPPSVLGYESHLEPMVLAEFLARYSLVTVGVVKKVVPGWTTSIVRPANLIFVEVDEVLRDTQKQAIPGGTLVLLRHSGAEMELDGRRFCSPKTESFDVRVGSRVVLFGVEHESDSDRVSGMIFEIRGEMVYPSPGTKHLKDATALPLWQVRQQVAEILELER